MYTQHTHTHTTTTIFKSNGFILSVKLDNTKFIIRYTKYELNYEYTADNGYNNKQHPNGFATHLNPLYSVI